MTATNGPGERGESPEEALDRAEQIAADVEAPEDGSARGMRTLAAEHFSLAEAIGGVRGLVESLAPGLVFVVVFVASSNLTWSLVASVGVAVVAVAVRLVQRTPVTQALGGLLGVVIGVIWAWRSGEGRNYFAWGLWTNGAYLVALTVSILVRWPFVGVVEALRAGWGPGGRTSQAATVDEPSEPSEEPTAPAWTAWRSDRSLRRRYALVTWLWVAMFGLRLVVQVPLYNQGEVGWLGTARLVMGVPLWALVLWLTWVLVRRPTGAVSSPDR